MKAVNLLLIVMQIWFTWNGRLCILSLTLQTCPGSSYATTIYGFVAKLLNLCYPNDANIRVVLFIDQRSFPDGGMESNLNKFLSFYLLSVSLDCCHLDKVLRALASWPLVAIAPRFPTPPSTNTLSNATQLNSDYTSRPWRGHEARLAHLLIHWSSFID